MKTGFLLRNLTLGAAFAALAFSAPAANAQNLRNFFYDSVAENQIVNITVNGTTENVYAGRYNGRLETAPGSGVYNSLKIFCTDATHNISSGNSYQTLVSLGLVTDAAGTLTNQGTVASPKYFYTDAFGNGSGLASALNSSDYKPNNGVDPTSAQKTARSQAVAYIIDTYLAPVSITTEQAAAAQLAIWDITQDGGDGFATGSFKSTISGTLLSAANLIRTTANGITVANNNAYWTQAPRSSTYAHLQDFAFRSTNAIPEPAFYQLSALILMGGSGLFLRRRKK